MDALQLKELKKNGFLPQVQPQHFSLRLRVAGGRISAAQLQKVYEVAEEYGQGYVHLTSRQSIEIPFVKLQDIETVKRALALAGLEPAAGGPRVRTITACQGSAVCAHGLIDTAALAEEFNQTYYGRELPHKFKLGITGCRNNCLKAEENDLGVRGGMLPQWHQEPCTYCGLCQKACSVGAIHLDREAERFALKQDQCVACGRCVKKCPTGALTGVNGFVVYFGGLFGNRITQGKKLLPLLTSKEELHAVVEATLDFFAKYAKHGERFATTLDRVGWDVFEDALGHVRK